MCEGEEDNLKVGQMEYARSLVAEAEAGTRGWRFRNGLSSSQRESGPATFLVY